MIWKLPLIEAIYSSSYLLLLHRSTTHNFLLLQSTTHNWCRAEPLNQLHILGLDGDTLGVDGAHVGR